MTPLYFGSSRRRLFGVYDAPVQRDRRRAVVICNALGAEYYHAHRACRILARQLAGAGAHVLRFDYLGTGNSAGEARDCALTDWLESIAEAAEELRDMADVRKVALVGLRGGALLAAAAAAENPREVERILLWDPVADAGRCEDPADEISEAMAGELHGLPGKLRGVRLPTGLVLRTAPDPGDDSPLESWTGASDDAMAVRQCPGPSVWTTEGDFGSSGIPVDALKVMTEWLLARG